MPPVTTEMFGRKPMIAWRGVPLVPCDKLEVKSRYQSNQWLVTTSILLVRTTARPTKALSACNQTGIPGECLEPSRHG